MLKSPLTNLTPLNMRPPETHEGESHWYDAFPNGASANWVDRGETIPSHLVLTVYRDDSGTVVVTYETPRYPAVSATIQEGRIIKAGIIGTDGSFSPAEDPRKIWERIRPQLCRLKIPGETSHAPHADADL